MFSADSILLIAAAQGWLGEYWSHLSGATRDPFRGIYQLNSFDLAVMVPYFLVLGILAAYGFHRYWLVYCYAKYRANVPGKAAEPATWPKVTIQLPIYNERYVVERLVEAISRIDYPPELLEVQVLDDSTDETQAVALACVERHRALGLNIHYLHRANREGYKAGALAEGLKSATGEFIAIFDADFQPNSDFLRLTVPYFHDPHIAMVQTRWTYLNRDYSALTEVESILLDGHFVSRAWRPRPQRRFLQFQWHRRRLAPDRHRGRRRMAARYAHRGYRPLLPRAVARLAISLPAGDRVSFRTAGGDELF